jgi:hypothetical protein
MSHPEEAVVEGVSDTRTPSGITYHKGSKIHSGKGLRQVL